MGKVSIDRFKTAMDYHFQPRSLHFRLRSNFLDRIYPETTINRSTRDWPKALGSMFPSLFDDIRPSRFSRTQPRLKQTNGKHLNQSSSKVRIIPIQVEGDHSRRNNHSETLSAVNSKIFDDDVAEIIDCSTDDLSPDFTIDTFKHRKRPSGADTKSHDSPILIDGDDTQESVSQDLSKCAIQKLEATNIKKATCLEGTDAVLISQESKLKTITTGSPILIDVEDAQESIIQNISDNSKLDNSCSSRKNPFLNDIDSSVSDLTTGICNVQHLGDSTSPDDPVYDMLRKKLKNEQRQIRYITGDGNCFFRALSKVMYGIEGNHSSVRRLIVDIIKSNKSQFAQFIDQEDFQKYVTKMSEDACWATTCEIYAAATVLQRDIYILTPNHLNSIYSWLRFKPLFRVAQKESKHTTHPCCITLCNTNGIHYDLVVADHGKCNCFMPDPELDGISASIDLT